MGVERSTLYTALKAFQSDPPPLVKDSVNPHYRSRYVSLHALLEAVLPALNRHGLVLVQPISSLGVETRIVHAESGMEVSAITPLALNGQDTPQAQGSAITYARRYGIMSMLGLVADEDDDGNAASTTQRQQTPAPEPYPAKVTTGQLTALHAAVGQLVKDHGYNQKFLRDGILETYGVTSTKELTRAQASEAIDTLKKQIAEAQAAPTPF
jgi:hypothetical protein